MKQVTRIGNIISNYININYGIPQGTALGPILFLMYMNDIFKVRSSDKVKGLIMIHKTPRYKIPLVHLINTRYNSIDRIIVTKESFEFVKWIDTIL